MQFRKIFIVPSLVLAAVLFSSPVQSQQARMSVYFSGGMSLPGMADIKNIYMSDLENYEEVSSIYDLCITMNYYIHPNISLRLGVVNLSHEQSPAVAVELDEDETWEGSGNFRISAYTPFLGVYYNQPFLVDYTFGLGADLVYSMATLDDNIPDIDLFYAALKDKGIGFMVGANLRRSLGSGFEVGVEMGYRFVNNKKLKIDSVDYVDFTEDVEYTVNGKTIDLDFTGPYARLLIGFSL